MKVRYWGVRGSIPVPGPKTVRVGGNTPCVSVELWDGTLLVIDGGTGLRSLGRHLLADEAIAAGKGRATLLISHRHWDHIQGIPFFEPAYIAGNLFDVYSPALDTGGDPLEDNVVSLSYAPANFPVPYDQMRAAYRFHTAREGTTFRVGSAHVQPLRMHHPGRTLGYVVTDQGSSAGSTATAKIAYLCDTGPWELSDPGKETRPDTENPRSRENPSRHDRLIAAIRGADLVIHDTFFEPAGYEGREGWGHSTPVHALNLCRNADVRRLHLFHFAPDLEDDAVSLMESEARAVAGALEVKAAIEGLEITLP